MGLMDKITGRTKKAAGDLTGRTGLRRKGQREERKGEAKEEKERAQERADRKAAEAPISNGAPEKPLMQSPDARLV